MVNKYMGLLILNEKEDNIMSLTKNRPLASIPFAGRYRIIDFALSNLVNFRVNNVGIITQSNSRSLIDHLGSGSHWDLDRKRSGIFVFNFSSYTNDINDAKILMDNLEYLYRSKEEYVIVSSSYMICNINYEEAAKFHEESNADITVISTKTGNGKKEYLGCDALNVDENNKVLSVGKNYGGHNDLNISMEMYLMKKDILIDLLYKTVETGYYSSIKEAINKNISNINIKNFEFKGYVKCINSIDAFYKANMDMLNLEKSRELFFKNGLIMTKVMDEAPAKYT
ncbi:MAG: glucose-1-phosphate adenylyltransferase subunit GlgD, partial [Clostridiaceae bacterium]